MTDTARPGPRPMVLLACEPDGTVAAAWQVPDANGARDLLGTACEAEGIITADLARDDASGVFRIDPARYQVTPADTARPQGGPPMPTAHTHRHAGQALRHAHPGGAEPHGYYGHPPDTAPRGTRRTAHGLFGLDDRETTYQVTGGRLRGTDLPVPPGRLKAARVVDANVPRLTGPDWLFIHSPVSFEIELPAGLAPGTVVEWADAPDEVDTDRAYTVVTALTAESVTFSHHGRGAAGALAAAFAASALRERR